MDVSLRARWVSTTGYWGHFAPMDEVEETGNIKDYARLLAIDYIDPVLFIGYKIFTCTLLNTFVESVR